MIDKHLSPHLSGYRKGCSTQIFLISVLEKWKLYIDNKCFITKHSISDVAAGLDQPL